MPKGIVENNRGCISQGSPEKQNQQNVYMYKDIYYENLAHTIMQADKSQDLQGELASWRLGRADGVVPVQRPADLRPRKC